MIHDTLFTVTTTVVLGTSVDGAADVISVEKGVTLTAHRTGRRFRTQCEFLGIWVAFRAKNKNNGGKYQRDQWEPALR